MMRSPNLLRAGVAGLLLVSMVHTALALGESPCGRNMLNGLTNARLERVRFGEALAKALAGGSAVALVNVREVSDAPADPSGRNSGASQRIVLDVDGWVYAEARELPASITVRRFVLHRDERPDQLGGTTRFVRPAHGMRLLVFVRSERDVGAWTVDDAFEDPAAVPAARAGVAFHERFEAGTATVPEDLSDEYFARFYETYLTEGARPHVELHVRLLLDYLPRARQDGRSAVGFALARHLSPKGSLQPETRAAVEAAIVREATGDDPCAGGLAVRFLDWAMTAGGLDVTPHLDSGALERLAANYRAYFTFGKNVPRLQAIDRVLSIHPDGSRH